MHGELKLTGLVSSIKSVSGWFNRDDTEGKGQKEVEFYVDMLDGEAEGSLEMAGRSPAVV